MYGRAVPRIKWRRSSLIFDQLSAHWTLRYGVALVVSVLPGILSFLFGARLGIEFYLLPVFAAALVASVIGGLGPGLLATILAVVVGYEVPRWRVSLDELRLLLIGGALVSIGGTLRAELIKDRDRHRAALKLEQQIVETSDEERRRIGHELHDRLGQHLTGISMLSETLAQKLDAGLSPSSADFEMITQLMSQAIGITRDLARSLSPITLEQEGLPSALVEMAETCSALFGVSCTCEYTDEHPPLDQTRSLHLFRVAQEAVNNALRHGKAKNIRIRVVRENSSVKVIVADDGVGLSEKTSQRPGLGLRIMQHRARMLQASLTVARAATDGGTVVTCICPLDVEVRWS
jgi:signal transduction histidine kinase